jgi:hypothetical protein
MDRAVAKATRVGQKVMQELYADVITEALQSEDDRSSSMEKRALGVISAAGVLSTLMLGFSTLVSRSPGPPGQALLTVWIRIALVAALVAFAIAATLALLVTSPRNYLGHDVDDIRSRIVGEGWDEWDQPQSRAATWDFELKRVTILDRAQKLNTQKSRLLQTAISVEVAGIAGIATSVGLLLFTA